MWLLILVHLIGFTIFVEKRLTELKKKQNENFSVKFFEFGGREKY